MRMKLLSAPYRSDEIADAVLEAARREGVRLRRLMVTADERARLWVVRVIGEEGNTRSLTLPFSTRRGICTPAEIANAIVHDRWPFGYGRPESGLQSRWYRF